MSAFIVCKRHIDFMVSAGLAVGAGGRGALAWRDPAEAEPGATRERGAPWGPEWVAYAKRVRRELTPDTADRVGAMLVAANRASVNHRYDEAELEDLYEFKWYGPPPYKAVAVLKAIACYEYQSCEHPEWGTSEAKAFCAALRHAYIDRLPGYDEAQWEVR